jgi:signal transduction histidine kinase
MIRLRDRTVGLRFTLLYGAVFLASGAVLLALAFLLSGGAVSDVDPVPGQVPPAQVGADEARQRVMELQRQLADVDAEHSRQMLIGSLLALVVMAVVSLLAGRAMAKRVLRPLRRITASTQRISADSLDRRLAVGGPADEVKDLADTIDGLLERLESAFAAQRRFAADASHELRTPLATMRASIDVAAAKPSASGSTLALAERLRPQLDQTDRLLDSLLALARAQHGLGDPADVDLAELVTRAVADRDDAMRAKRLQVETALPQGMTVRGDTALLSSMVENLVDNAVAHNAESGWIRIELARAGGEVGLVVANGGHALTQYDVDVLAQPFRRFGSDRTGSDGGAGLGLSIVAAIIAAHDGRLDLTARPEGGLLVRIFMPLVPAPTEVVP